METNNLTSAQSALIYHYIGLPKEQAVEELKKIVKPNEDGATIVGDELRKAFDTLGYDGKEEVSRITWDFADQLAAVYREKRRAL